MIFLSFSISECMEYLMPLTTQCQSMEDQCPSSPTKSTSAIGATANVIGGELGHLVDAASHYVQDEVHNFIEQHTTGKKRRRQPDLASATNDTTEHAEDMHKPDGEGANNIAQDYPANADGPNSETGFKQSHIRTFERDKLFSMAPGKWALEHLRAKMGGDLFSKLCQNVFVTGLSINWSFINYTGFPGTIRMVLVHDLHQDDLDKWDSEFGNREVSKHFGL